MSTISRVLWQVSRLLDVSATAYDITHLHENTNYDICVLRMRQPTITSGSGGSTSGSGGESSTALWWDARACVSGTTSTDSLSVALGSTFGAFLALGLIVALVFVAKWQHSRRANKRQQVPDVATGNGAAGKTAAGAGAQLGDGDDDEDEVDDADDDDDVLRVEIADLDYAGLHASRHFLLAWFSLFSATCPIHDDLLSVRPSVRPSVSNVGGL